VGFTPGPTLVGWANRAVTADRKSTADRSGQSLASYPLEDQAIGEDVMLFRLPGRYGVISLPFRAAKDGVHICREPEPGAMGSCSIQRGSFVSSWIN